VNTTRWARAKARAGRRLAISAVHRRRGPELPAPLPDRVHYACGQNVMAGWLNVDGMTWSYPGGFSDAAQVMRVDLSGRHPFPDGAFQFAYAEDFLEHLTQADSLVFLAEALRTLDAGGVLRLSFPCLEGVLDKHYPDPSLATAVRARREAYEMWGHEHFYSLDAIELVARHLGFSSVKKVEYGESEHEELQGLETRHEQIGLNLNVELTR
jgi:predicted SAM-dependent methyltransferase